MFALGPYMSYIPLSALAGVLIMTAWRMNGTKLNLYLETVLKQA